MNPLDDRQLDRLRKSIQRSCKELESFRRKRIDSLMQYAGQRYKGKRLDDSDKTPINVLKLATCINVTHLVSSNPRALVTTPHARLQAGAFELELALNEQVKRLKLEQTLRLAVLDAHFGMGIVKVGFDREKDIEFGGEVYGVGSPFAEQVLLEDWVHDFSARRYDQVAYCGNRYRLPYDLVMQSKLFDRAAVSDLRPDDSQIQGEGEEQKSEYLSHDGTRTEDKYRDEIELWDIWDPRERVVFTVRLDSKKPPLRVVDWDGPDCGPYHLLGFADVPGNVMPSPPADDWMDLHVAINHIANKVIRGAEAQKNMLGVQPGGGQDAENIIQAVDGDVIKIATPGGVIPLAVGGADAPSIALLAQLRQIFSYQAGNLDALGGLAPQAGTLGQDQLLTSSASKQAQDKQGRVIIFTTGVVHDIAWYMWTDPFLNLAMKYMIPGTEIEDRLNFTAKSKQGRFLDYNFAIDPYSMQHQSPSERLQTLTNVFQQFILPFQPQLQAAGGSINFDRLLKLVSKLAGFDELQYVVSFSSLPLESEPVDGEDDPGKPDQTTRTYNRVNTTPGRTDRGMAQTMMQLGMGGKPQAGELAGLLSAGAK